MIRKYVEGRKLEDGEKVLVAIKDVTIRKDGEKALLRKGKKYIVSGYYEEFDEVEFVTEAEPGTYEEEDK